jgi:hypothetical protein
MTAPRSQRRSSAGAWAILASGALVPDGVTVALIAAPRGGRTRWFALDGFPATWVTDALDGMLREIGLAGRDPSSTCPTRRDQRSRRAGRGSRPDDTPEVIARRLEIYHPRRSRSSSTTGPRAAGALHRAPSRAGLGRDRLGAQTTRGRMIIRKSQAEIEAMAAAGASSRALALLGESLAPA